MPYAKMWDMPLGGTSDQRQVPHWFGNFAYAIVGGAFKICFRYRVDGRGSLRGFRDKSGVLVVANHKSFLDVVFIYLAARTSQWVRIMGRDTLFSNAHGFVGQILSRVGGFPVKRDAADRTSIKRATRMLKNNELVGVFPEGTRRGKGSRPPEMHSGAALLAKMAHAPILPMTVRNDELVKQKGKFLRFPKITVEYGTPILVEDFDFLPKEDRLDACMWYTMRECFALSKQIPANEVDMRELFPDSKDFTEVFATHSVASHTTDAICEEKEAQQSKQSESAQSTDSRSASAQPTSAQSTDSRSASAQPTSAPPTSAQSTSAPPTSTQSTNSAQESSDSNATEG